MHALVGTWRLVEWTVTIHGRPAAQPFGGHATGLLTYTADGRMWATLMREGRPPLGSTTLAAATPSARAAAAAGYLSYAGTYVVEGAVVRHLVEVSLFPDWIGGVQVRHISWEDDDLVLASADTVTRDGAEAANRLRWRRITGGQA